MGPMHNTAGLIRKNPRGKSSPNQTGEGTNFVTTVSTDEQSYPDATILLRAGKAAPATGTNPDRPAAPWPGERLAQPATAGRLRNVNNEC